MNAGENQNDAEAAQLIVTTVWGIEPNKFSLVVVRG